MRPSYPSTQQRMYHRTNLHPTWTNSNDYNDNEWDDDINNTTTSASQEIQWSVPPGLYHKDQCWARHFLVYLLPLRLLIRKHGLELHAYADNTQLFISIRPVNQCVVDIWVAKTDNCHTDIYI